VTTSNGFPRATRFGWSPEAHRRPLSIPLSASGCSIRLPNATAAGQVLENGPHETGAGRERLFITVAALIDTNILVYRFDDRFPDKQKIATDLLRRGILDNSVRVPHQAIVEFIAAVTRPIRGYVILPQADALREAEEFLRQFTVLYPNEAIVRNAIRGCAAYQMNWFDAHLWSYAEHYGLSEIITEDLQHDWLYGTVRTINPFIGGRRGGRKLG
jgi:predicted nucleic acid-binding protein